APARLLLPVGACALLLSASLGAALLGAVAPAPDQQPAPPAVDDIPQPYLLAYEQAVSRFDLGNNGWAYLAAVRKIEADHRRPTAAGGNTGQNTNGCCAGPMQIHNGFGTGGGTWGAYKVDGDGDDRANIYDPADAAATAAHYLRASGAPADWRRALFAYNHAN